MKATEKLAKEIEARVDKEKNRIEEAKRNKLTGADRFLIKKYKCYLKHTINELGNRDTLLSHSFLEDNDFNRTKSMEKVSDEIFIDKITLFKHFALLMKKEKIPNIDPFLFEKALEQMVGKPFLEYEGYLAQFYIEKIRINDKGIYRIIF